MEDFEIALKKWGLQKIKEANPKLRTNNFKKVYVEYYVDTYGGCDTCGYGNTTGIDISNGEHSVHLNRSYLDFGEFIRELAMVEITDEDRTIANK